MSLDDDKTPILLHPTRRIGLLTQGRDLFNNERFHEARSIWEDLWHVEYGRDKVFVQGLVDLASHFDLIQAGNWPEAESTANQASRKLSSPLNRAYRELDVIPIIAALDYNVGLLATHRGGNTPSPLPEAFLVPKLFEK